MSTHVMIDLETLGTSTDALILSIGACKLDTKSLTIDDSVHIAIDPVSAQAAGLKIDASTVLWWMDAERDQARRDYMALPKVDLHSALYGFSQWFGNESIPVWGNGATFDNVILRRAFELAGLPCPWQFYHDRCYRSLKNLWPETKLERRGTHHSALDDALSQAEHMLAIIRLAHMEGM